jgi:hypothetical protein
MAQQPADSVAVVAVIHDELEGCRGRLAVLPRAAAPYDGKIILSDAADLAAVLLILAPPVVLFGRVSRRLW